MSSHDAEAAVNVLGRYLALGNIVCNLTGRESGEVIRELAVKLSESSAGLDPEVVIAEVSVREKLMPTVIAPGLAVPHARISSLTAPLVAIGTSPDGVSFGTDAVQVAVMVLTPPDDPGLHLQIIAALARAFREPGSVGRVAALAEPRDVLAYFGGDEMVVPSFLVAGDLLSGETVTMLESETLHLAIRKFAVSGVDEIVILDHDGDLRGVLHLADVLAYSLPEHLLWLDDLTSIRRFEPFAEALKNSDDTRIADIMREDFVRVEADIPAIQLAKIFIMNKIRQVVVVGSDGRFRGVVELRNFCARLFWE